MSASNVIPGEYIDVLSGLDVRGYALDEVLGRGGVGVVFAATHEATPVAVKVAWPWATPDASWNGESTRQRLRVPKLDPDGRTLRYIPPTDQGLCNRIVHAEYVRLKAVSHDAVVKVQGEFTLDHRAAYVMSRVEGERMKLTPGEHLTKLAKILHELHEQDWPHGDLKPENIRVKEDGTITLIDPLPIAAELATPEWAHLNFLVSTPLVDSADPRDRRMVWRHRDLVALALMAVQAWTGERPWSHANATKMFDRAVSMDDKRAEINATRERLEKIIPKAPVAARPFLALALDPGLWPDDGPIFAAYLQSRPFETRCDALASLDVGEIFSRAAAQLA